MAASSLGLGWRRSRGGIAQTHRVISAYLAARHRRRMSRRGARRSALGISSSSRNSARGIVARNRRRRRGAAAASAAAQRRHGGGALSWRRKWRRNAHGVISSSAQWQLMSARATRRNVIGGVLINSASARPRRRGSRRGSRRLGSALSAARGGAALGAHRLGSAARHARLGSNSAHPALRGVMAWRSSAALGEINIGVGGVSSAARHGAARRSSALGGARIAAAALSWRRLGVIIARRARNRSWLALSAVGARRIAAALGVNIGSSAHRGSSAARPRGGVAHRLIGSASHAHRRLGGASASRGASRIGGSWRASAAHQARHR